MAKRRIIISAGVSPHSRSTFDEMNVVPHIAAVAMAMMWYIVAGLII